VIVVV